MGRSSDERFIHEALKGPSTFRNYTHSELRFRAVLTEDGAQVLFHREAYDEFNEAVV